MMLAMTAAIAVAAATPRRQPASASLTLSQVKNSSACLPSLAAPPDLMVPFKDYNTIRLYGEDPLHHRTIATPLVVTTSAFTRCQISANR